MSSNFRTMLRKCLSLILLCVIAAQGITIHAEPPIADERSGVVITIGKPSIWTLAQAHYLLAQVHNTNRGLQVASLGDLDPNGINRQRIEVLRTMFGASVDYNQITGLKNDLTQQRYALMINRQREVRSLTDQRRNELYQVTRELTLLQSEIGQLRTAQNPNEELIKAKEDEKTAKLAERDVLREQIVALETEAKSLSADAGASIPSFTAASDGSSNASSQPTSPLASLVDKSTIDSLLKDAARGSSQLDASRRLDNYIQMQYELIAKQLTLLRDEVGRNERIVFLELPSSVYTVPKKSDRSVVQVRWQVTRFLPYSASEKAARDSPITNLCVPRGAFNNADSSSNVAENQIISVKSLANVASQLGVRTIKQRSSEVTQIDSEAPTQPTKVVLKATLKPRTPGELKAQAVANEKGSQIKLYWTDNSALDPDGATEEFQIFSRQPNKSLRMVGRVPAGQTEYIDRNVIEGQEYTYFIVASNSEGDSPQSNSVTVTAGLKFPWENVSATDPTVRTVDIIPRQSALNVNQAHDTSNGLNLAAKFFAFAGLGGKVEYQRQREIYDQFVYQDVFASGYGKGESVFGWTFGALPGSKRISPGVRTTYAVLVVPSRAKRLTLTAQGFAFDQNHDMPKWDAKSETYRTFDIDIPGDEGDGFDLSAVEYAPVRSGNRITMILRGEYFSPQLGILINGIPLKRVVSIAQGEHNGSSNSTGGEFEYVGSKKVIASFSMGSLYEGTPIITLVTPERTSDINRLDVKINNSDQSCDSLEMHSLLDPMFSLPLSLDSSQLIDIGSNDCVTLGLQGKGFKSSPSISVNGKTIQDTVDECEDIGGGLILGSIQQRSTNQFLIRFPKPKEPNWKFSIRQNGKQGQEEAIPLLMTRPLTRQVSYEILRYRPPQKKVRAELTIKLDVSNFDGTPDVQVVESDGLKALPSPIQLSPGELMITVQPERDLRLEPLILLVSLGAIKAQVSILPPLAPTIKAIVNPNFGDKPEGHTDTEYAVVIQGENLEYVERVFFGSKPARILNISSESLTVLAPKGDEGTVQVRLETNISYLGKLLTNVGDFAAPNSKATFTYKLKPKSPSGG